jgi:hypothetical protein
MLSTLLFTLPFAALAAADLTTSVWGPYVDIGDSRRTFSVPTQTYSASVVNVNNDRTTLAVIVDYPTISSETIPGSKHVYTMTFGPSYYNVISPVTRYGRLAGGINLTVSDECTSSTQGAAIVCTEIYNSPEVFSSICGRGPHSSEAKIVTESSIQYISGYPQLCFITGTYPFDFQARTFTVGQSSLTTTSIKLVITAGEEKLSATTGSTPTNTGPPATGGATTSTGTGGVGPMKTSAPLLAGLGAAMAVFVL